MELRVKSFPELSNSELYEILRVRSQVFVVEQECAYQDIDGKDRESNHLFLVDEDSILAYARIFEDGDHYRIGRVLTTVRGKGYGSRVLRASIEEIRKRSDKECI